MRLFFNSFKVSTKYKKKRDNFIENASWKINQFLEKRSFAQISLAGNKKRGRANSKVFLQSNGIPRI